MKKILFLISLLFVLSAKAQTSVYHPFPDSSAIWNFHTSQVMCIPFGSIESYYSITISGDTLIGSQIYHKLSTPFVQSIISGLCTPYIHSGYDGAIRQDTANKKVFYVPPSNSIEQLLYDFNMQVGDTVKGFLESFASPPDTVQSIDSVLVGSDYRKRWNINPCYNIHLIEGIGSTFGLIQLSPGCITDASGFLLTCFTQNGMTLYPDTTTNCDLITDVKNISDENIFLKIFPIPFSSEISITFQNQNVNQAIISIKNILGQTVFSKEIKPAIETKVDLSFLEKGIYLVEVVLDGERMVKKIVKD